MKVPISWLKEYVDFDLSAEQIATKLTMGGLEVEGIEESAIGPVLDVYVTPNRGDCLSVLGVAREVSALLASPLKSVSRAGTGSASVSLPTSVIIEDAELCPRYAARIVEGIKIGPSPLWIQQRLEAAGQRAVNNVVDVTNYVLLELGQPLHAFDLDKLAEQRIVVRQARPGEQIKTLDGEERELAPPMLVIADAIQPVAVAGIMGGADSEVSASTTRILIESAHFNPLSVRRTSRALNLRTEASYRFERVVDPGGVLLAVDRACELLQRIGQPAAIPGVVDQYPYPLAATRLELRTERAAKLLGMELDAAVCEECLTALGFGVAGSDGASTLAVTIPSYRADISIEEDLIEEIGRIHGYENIPETLPVGETTRGGDSEQGRFISRIRRIMVECGLQEVVTHSLTAPSFFNSPADALRRVSVRNALSANIGGLRRSLLPTLIDVAQHNAAHGQHNLALFEIGRIWQNEQSESAGEAAPVEYLSLAGLMVGAPIQGGWRSGKVEPADYTAIKGVLDRLMEKLRITGCTLRPLSDRPDWLTQLHPGRAATISLGGGRPDGIIGELHPAIAATLDLRNRPYIFELSVESLERSSPGASARYQPISRQQAVLRDIAPRVSEDVPYAAVSAAIAAADVPILSEFHLTDLYRGAPLEPGIKSLTVSLTFTRESNSLSEDRPLSDQEVNEALTVIRSELAARCGAVFPS